MYIKQQLKAILNEESPLSKTIINVSLYSFLSHEMISVHKILFFIINRLKYYSGSS